MKGQNILIILGLLGIFVIILALTINSNIELRKENHRLTNNQTALKKQMQEYILADSTQKITIDELNISRDEFIYLWHQAGAEVIALEKKVKNLQHYNQSTHSAQYHIDTLLLKDTIFVENNRIDTLKALDYSNPYISLNAKVLQDTIKNLKIVTFDTITTITTKEYRKRFLCFKWKPYYQTTIHNKNPYSRITHAESIRVE